MNKKTTLKTCGLLFYFLTATFLAHSQVGIDTTDPDGILDIASTNTGVVLPRMSLTSTIVQAPAVNPKTGVTVIPAGTTVYNDNTTTNATNNVYPGMYVWDGSKWLAYAIEKQNELYEQTSVAAMRTVNGLNIIAGLDAETFTANYTGTYRIEIRVNYGGGGAVVPAQGSDPSTESDGYLNIAQASGDFNFIWDGTSHIIPAHAFSTSYDPAEGATNYFAIWEEYSATFTVQLTAGDVIPFSLDFTQNAASTYVDNGNSGSGRGYVGYDIPCTVEINYVGD